MKPSRPQRRPRRRRQHSRRSGVRQSLRHDGSNKRREHGARLDSRSEKGKGENSSDWNPRPSRARMPSRPSQSDYWQPWKMKNESGRTLREKMRDMTLDQTRVTCVDFMKHHRPIPTTVTPQQTSVPAPHTRRARSTSHHSSASIHSSGSIPRTISIPSTISLPTAPTCITIITINLTLNFLRTVSLPTVPTRSTIHPTTIVKNPSTNPTSSTSIPDHHTAAVHSRKHHPRR